MMQVPVPAYVLNQHGMPTMQIYSPHMQASMPYGQQNDDCAGMTTQPQQHHTNSHNMIPLDSVGEHAAPKSNIKTM